MPRENPLLTMIREVCALGRAELSRPYTDSGDPVAARRLIDGLKAVDPSGQPSDISLSLDLLAPRALYFDQLLLDAITAGASQIVNLGAGYDDRALRFRTAGVEFFELDLPEVTLDKTRRLELMDSDTTHMPLVGIDLGIDDTAEVLARAGHDADRPTVFIAEHLMLFLEPDDVDRLVAATAMRAAAGSTFAVTAEVHPEGFDSKLIVTTADNEMFGGTGPLHTIRTRDAWLALLDKAGWTVSAADDVRAVDHFVLPMSGQDIQIQTQFLTATM